MTYICHFTSNKQFHQQKGKTVSILEEYCEYRDRSPGDKAKQILFETFGDLLRRKGFSQTWEEVDDAIKAEILEVNLAKIQARL